MLISKIEVITIDAKWLIVFTYHCQDHTSNVIIIVSYTIL